MDMDLGLWVLLEVDRVVDSLEAFRAVAVDLEAISLVAGVFLVVCQEVDFLEEGFLVVALRVEDFLVLLEEGFRVVALRVEDFLVLREEVTLPHHMEVCLHGLADSWPNRSLSGQLSFRPCRSFQSRRLGRSLQVTGLPLLGLS